MESCNSFYINNIKIDISRSLIIKGDSAISVEPKVLRVLHVLVKNKGNVVTHKALMEDVWKGTEVVPNALQRCIAVLRRELDDNARDPQIIATHPKIGYSLLADVKWEAEAKVANPNALTTHFSYDGPIASKLLILSLLLIVVMAAALWVFSQFVKDPSLYTSAKQLTHTDEHETELIFSPDGEYVVFKRYAGACADHVWARNIESGKEYQLTSNPGGYKDISFTTGGRELVFASSGQCGIESRVSSTELSSVCWSIASLDFSLSLKSAIEPTFRHQCGAQRVINPRLLPNNKYAYLVPTETNYDLVIYDELSGETKPLYSSMSEYTYHYDYSDKLNAFVVFSKTQDYRNHITVLDLAGNVRSKNELKMPDHLNRNAWVKGHFTADDEHLIGIAQGTLFQLNLDGNFEVIHSQLSDVVYADIHPSKDMLMVISGTKDLDIAQIRVGDKPESKYITDLNQIASPFQSLARANSQDHLAYYQPNGSLIAFVSDRSGSDAVWLWDGSRAVELPDSSSRKTITGLAWSNSGDLLAWSEDEDIIISDLDGVSRTIKSDKPISSLLNWLNEEQMIVAVNDPSPGALYLLNLTNHQLTPLGISNVESVAALNDQIIYSTYAGEVYSQPLNSSGIRTKINFINSQSFFVFENHIYSVDSKTLQLNKYSPQGDLIDSLIQLTPTTWKVSDFDGQHVLLYQFIGINNEIYEVK